MHARMHACTHARTHTHTHKGKTTNTTKMTMKYSVRTSVSPKANKPTTTTSNNKEQWLPNKKQTKNTKKLPHTTRELQSEQTHAFLLPIRVNYVHKISVTVRTNTCFSAPNQTKLYIHKISVRAHFAKANTAHSMCYVCKLHTLFHCTQYVLCTQPSHFIYTQHIAYMSCTLHTLFFQLLWNHAKFGTTTF